MKKENNFVSMGIVSLFLIFAVFCMVILCLLTYNTSKSDYISARESMTQTSRYYEAYSQVTDLCLQLKQDFEKLASSSLDETVFYADAEKQVLPDQVSYDPTLKTIYIHYPFSETQELYVEMLLTYDADGASDISILAWNTQTIGEWTPDLHQNVYLEGAYE